MIRLRRPGRPYRRKLTRAERSLIVALTQKGFTQRHISRIVRRAVSDISRIQHAAQVTPAWVARHVLADEKRAEIVELARAGKRRRAIAEQFSIHPVTVSRILKRANHDQQVPIPVK